MNDNILYEALGIDRNASNQQINRAYLKVIQENQSNPEKIELINVSYQVLTDPKLRQIYDCKGLDGLNSIDTDNETTNTNSNPPLNHEKNHKNIDEEKTIDNLLYDTLKLSRDATLTDIQNAYEREYILITSSVDSLMNIDLQKIQLLNAAYNVLTNPEIRRVYDKSGIAGVNQMQEKERNQQEFADNVLYEILGVNRFADDEEIRISYLNLLKNADYSDKERIKMIHSAYSVLSVPKIRKVYDIEGIEGINKKFTTIQFDEKILKKNDMKIESEIDNYKNLLYETLGVDRDAPITQIRFAYQKKLRELHKKFGCIDDQSEEVQLIKASFNVLSNPKLREIYDEGGIAAINRFQSEEENNEILSNSENSSNETKNFNNSKKSTNENKEFSNSENSSNENETNNLNNSNKSTNESEKFSNSENSTNENKDFVNSENKKCSNSNENENECDADILYDAIGAKRGASFIEIQMSFLKKLNETVNSDDSEKSQLIHAAYDVLSDPMLRKIYDSGGIGAINKVYEERARMNEEHQQNTEQISIQKDDIFITQSKSGTPFLEEIDSDTENNDEKSSKDPFYLSDDEDTDRIKSSSPNDDDKNETEGEIKGETKGEIKGETKDEIVTEEVFEKLELSLEQLYNGCIISKEIQIEICCPHCKGTGNEYCEPFPICPVCNGSGQKIEMIEKPVDFLTSERKSSLNQKKKFNMKRICEKCLGRGELRTEYSVCCVCYGLKKFKSDFKVDIQIKPGTSDGEIVKIPLKIEGEATDVKWVIFKIVQKKHGLFEKVGNDLIYIKKINLTQALSGILSFPIETLDKRIIVVNGDKNIVVQPNSSFVIKNEGFPIKNELFCGNQMKGDLIVKFIVELPSVFSLGPKVVNMLKIIQPLNDPKISYDRSKILKDKLYFYQLPYESVSEI